MSQYKLRKNTNTDLMCQYKLSKELQQLELWVNINFVRNTNTEVMSQYKPT